MSRAVILAWGLREELVEGELRRQKLGEFGSKNGGGQESKV
jgi:hypothetical protein